MVNYLFTNGIASLAIFHGSTLKRKRLLRTWHTYVVFAHIQKRTPLKQVIKFATEGGAKESWTQFNSRLTLPRDAWLVGWRLEPSASVDHYLHVTSRCSTRRCPIGCMHLHDVYVLKENSYRLKNVLDCWHSHQAVDILAGLQDVCFRCCYFLRTFASTPSSFECDSAKEFNCIRNVMTTTSLFHTPLQEHIDRLRAFIPGSETGTENRFR